MFVLVAGGGRVGSQLTQFLLEHDYKVRLIENRPPVLERLHREIPTEVIITGDPSIPITLEQAGIQQASVLAAVLSNDSQNLTLSSMAKFTYNVPRVIGRVNDPRNAWLFTPKMGVDVALNQADILARLIAEEMSMGDMMTLLKLRRGRYSLVEEKIPPGAKAIGIAIKDLQLPENCVIAAIIRHGQMVVPRGITTFQINDEVLAIADDAGASELDKLFAGESISRP